MGSRNIEDQLLKSGSTRDESLSRAAEIAHRYANEIDAELEVAMDTARTLALTFEALKAGGRTDRNMLGRLLENVLEESPDFIGVWTCWEPNAVDGEDARYADTTFHDSTGRFIPYYRREAGQITVERLVDYDKRGSGGTYLLARDSGDEVIAEPHHKKTGSKDVFMTSLAEPIHYQGKVVGVAGVDLALKKLQDLVGSLHPFGTGVTAIFANKGTIAAHFDPSRLGRQLQETEKSMSGEYLQPFAEAVRNGREFVYSVYAAALDSDLYIRTVPLVVGNSKTPWGFAVGIPIKSGPAPAVS